VDAVEVAKLNSTNISHGYTAFYIVYYLFTGVYLSLRLNCLAEKFYIVRTTLLRRRYAFLLRFIAVFNIFKLFTS
jgi:hypothetical protein